MIVLRYLWCILPTALGYVIGMLGLITGGKAQRFGWVWEFYGGFVTWYLGLFPIRPIAMTLGFVVLGNDAEDLARSRDHELIHVRQYGVWGPFFIPAYGISSIVQWAKGNRAYRDNMFEVEAYAEAPVLARSEAEPQKTA